MERIYTEGAPAPIGAYSQGVLCQKGKLLFVSGQLGFDPQKGSYKPLDIEQESRWALRNMESVLKGGWDGSGGSG